MAAHGTTESLERCEKRPGLGGARARLIGMRGHFSEKKKGSETKKGSHLVI